MSQPIKKSQSNNKKASSLEKLWDRQLHNQWMLTRGPDITFFQNRSEWKAARHVLEVGCGTAHFLEHLATYFPEKIYRGVDIQPRVLQRGLEVRERNPHVHLYQGDLLNLNRIWKNTFDFVIARLVLQHLSSIDEFLESVGCLFRPGGTLLVYDANDSMTKFEPRVPAVENLMQLLAQKQGKTGVGRQWWDELSAKCGRYSLKVQGTHDVVFSSAVKETKLALFRTFGTLGSLATRQFGLDIDLPGYRKDLSEWKNKPNSYGQIGMRAVLLRKRRSLIQWFKQ